jgi:hypothetical protein
MWMRQTLALFGLLALGCGAISTSVQVTTIAVGPGTPIPPINIPVVPPNPQPAPMLPVIQLEYAGTRVTGRETQYLWQAGSSQGAGGGGAITAPLTLPFGAGLDIVVTHPTQPALLVVIELDANDVPVYTTTLTPTALTTAYTPTRAGQYDLQVLAQWTADTIVIARFAVAVTP